MNRHRVALGELAGVAATLLRRRGSGPCCIGIALLLLWLLLCEVEVEVEVEEAAKAAANTKQCSRMRLDRFLVIGGE